jgi:hypothetical protein
MRILTYRRLARQSRTRKRVRLVPLGLTVAAFMLAVELIQGASLSKSFTLAVFAGVGGAAGAAILNSLSTRREATELDRRSASDD